ncbi:unnamed protein product [Cuscuta campestris]|uniref:J domain-containing protein n=2 Tax=Cuscuta campestris TaxID=132261 RepID=A0A484LCR2_9ASTE|nr:unnamed protein product [Cuscuta campestris]
MILFPSIQSWHCDFNDDYDSSSSQGWRWFDEDCSYNASNSSRSRNKGRFDEDFSYKASKSSKSRSKGSHKWSELRFVDDLGLEVENFFRTGFGGKHSFSWSFVNEDFPHRHSSRHSNTYGHSKQRFRHKYEYDDDDDYGSRELEMRQTDLRSQRLALGLNASGPLNLEDVKNAYRSCALKWHPDRHQGPSKVVAEEKFKACSSAYQSLCNNISLN